VTADVVDARTGALVFRGCIVARRPGAVADLRARGTVS